MVNSLKRSYLSSSPNERYDGGVDYRHVVDGRASDGARGFGEIYNVLGCDATALWPDGFFYILMTRT